MQARQGKQPSSGPTQQNAWPRIQPMPGRTGIDTDPAGPDEAYSPDAAVLLREEPRLPPLLPPPLLSPPSDDPPRAVVIMSPTAPVAAAAISSGAATISPARLPAADIVPPVSPEAAPRSCWPPDDWPCRLPLSRLSRTDATARRLSAMIERPSGETIMVSMDWSQLAPEFPCERDEPDLVRLADFSALADFEAPVDFDAPADFAVDLALTGCERRTSDMEPEAALGCAAPPRFVGAFDADFDLDDARSGALREPPDFDDLSFVDLLAIRKRSLLLARLHASRRRRRACASWQQPAKPRLV